MAEIQILNTKMDPPCKPPVIEYPITARENLQMVFDHKKPVWMPNVSLDLQNMGPVADGERPPNRGGGLDWFGQKWGYVDFVGGSTIAPDSWKLSHPSKWREEIRWPDLDKIDFSLGADEAAKRLDKSKMQIWSLGNGLFERFLDMTTPVDGFCWLMEEPEDAADYFNAMADFRIEVIKRVAKEWLPLDIIRIGDDWGTQLNTFISPDLFDELIMPPARRIFDCIRSLGIRPALHSCGKIEKLVPRIVELAPVFWEAQSNNDLQWIKDNFGDKLNMRLIFDRPLLETPGVKDEEITASLRSQLELWAKTEANYAPAEVSKLKDAVLERMDRFVLLVVAADGAKARAVLEGK